MKRNAAGDLVTALAAAAKLLSNEPAHHSFTPDALKQESHSALSPSDSRCSYADVQRRIDICVKTGAPIVIHTIVCLADNHHQAIIPVHPEMRADGLNLKENIYWGTAHGLKTFMQTEGWKIVARPEGYDDGVLEKLVFTKKLARHGTAVDVFLVAEAWRGDRMPDALLRFFNITSGNIAEDIKIKDEFIHSASGAHLVVFMGHNGLMEHRDLVLPSPNPDAPSRSAAVFACKSRPYFEDLISKMGANPLISTDQYMAPEAYLLKASIESIVAGDSPEEVRTRVADAYSHFQHCSLKAAKGVFAVSK